MTVLSIGWFSTYIVLSSLELFFCMIIVICYMINHLSESILGTIGHVFGSPLSKFTAGRVQSASTSNLYKSADSYIVGLSNLCKQSVIALQW